jgi:hypothetical protein
MTLPLKDLPPATKTLGARAQKVHKLKDVIAYLRTLLPKGKVVTKPAPRPEPWKPLFGLDYAWGKPSVRAMRGMGVHFVARYLSPMPNGKNLRPLERKALHAAGLKIVTVWESTAERARQGFDAGVIDAVRAEQQLRECGAPGHAVVYFAVDFDDQTAPVGDYFRGAVHVLGKSRVGVYGGYAVVKRLMDSGIIARAWQTYAWSGGAWYHGAQLRQFSNDHTVSGVGCDFDRAVDSDYGGW